MFAFHRFFFRILPVLLPLILSGGCASLKNRPTTEMVDSLLRTERKVVTVTLTDSEEALVQRMTQRAAACVESVVSSSGVAPAGPATFVPVRASMRQRLEEGRGADGGLWLALRMDGLIHGVAFGLHLRPLQDVGVEIKAFPADRRKPERIKELIASGEIFCSWREVSYPYD